MLSMKSSTSRPSSSRKYSEIESQDKAPRAPPRARRPRGRSPVTQGNRGEEGPQAMTMTDPVADMLTRLRNAHSAYRDSVIPPHSRSKVRSAESRRQEGYIPRWKVEAAE